MSLRCWCWQSKWSIVLLRTTNGTGEGRSPLSFGICFPLGKRETRISTWQRFNTIFGRTWHSHWFLQVPSWSIYISCLPTSILPLLSFLELLSSSWLIYITLEHIIIYVYSQAMELSVRVYIHYIGIQSGAWPCTGAVGRWFRYVCLQNWQCLQEIAEEFLMHHLTVRRKRSQFYYIGALCLLSRCRIVPKRISS